VLSLTRPMESHRLMTALEERVMGDKSPKKDNAKKPSKSLKEKRADKQSKRENKRPGFGQ